MEELNIKELKIGSFNEIINLDGKGYVVVGAQERTLSKKGIAQYVTGAYLVAVPIEISEELKQEGMAREIVHRLQTMRRSAGFDIVDHITTYYQGDKYTEQVMETFAEYIKRETLSDKLVKGVPGEGVFSESYKLAGNEILLAVEKLG
jgi:isoleucyl-tRNA synthetase